MIFSVVCDHCGRHSGMYETNPMCRECCDFICTDCGTEYDAESNRILCNVCLQAECQAFNESREWTPDLLAERAEEEDQRVLREEYRRNG